MSTQTVSNSYLSSNPDFAVLVELMIAFFML